MLQMSTSVSYIKKYVYSYICQFDSFWKFNFSCIDPLKQIFKLDKWEIIFMNTPCGFQMQFEKRYQ